MLLAQQASSETPIPWWVASIIVPLIAAVIGGGVSLTVQQVLLEAGVLHRFTEHLWKERAAAYRGLVTSSYNIVIRLSSESDTRMADMKLRTEQFLTELGTAKMLASNTVMVTANEFLEVFSQLFEDAAPGEPFESSKQKAVLSAHKRLLSAVRSELSIDPLSNKAKDWMPTLPRGLVE